MKYPLLYHWEKRPDHSEKLMQKDLINYIKEEATKNHFPSRRELETRLCFQLSPTFKGILGLYASAKINYKLAPNQQEKINKATILLNIISKNLTKLNLTLIKNRKVNERGIDILAFDESGLVGIELKAYNKGETLKLKDLIQVKKAIIQENLSRAIIITTTDKIKAKIMPEDKIRVITYSELTNILSIKHLSEIEYIQNSSVNIWTKDKELKRQRILDFVSTKYKKGIKSSYKLILKELNLDLYTYFDNLFEIYKILKVLPPTKNMRGLRAKYPDKDLLELWKTKFKEYILEETKKGHIRQGLRLEKSLVFFIYGT